MSQHTVTGLELSALVSNVADAAARIVITDDGRIGINQSRATFAQDARSAILAGTFNGFADFAERLYSRTPSRDAQLVLVALDQAVRGLAKVRTR